MSRWNLAWLTGVPLVVLLGLAVSYSAPVPAKARDYELVKLIVDVLGEVDQNYVRELDPDARRKLVEDMINGGLDRLDPYSSFFGATEYKQFDRKTRGKFGGVGIQVGQDRTTGMIQVTSPMVGTPAYEAGVRAGDLLVKVDGKSLEGMRFNEAIELVQGDPGTAVTLTVLHEGEKQTTDIPVTRAVITVETILGDRRKPDARDQWEWVIDPEHHLAYVRVTDFGDTTAESLKAALKQMEAEGTFGLVLDLRDNPGGLLSSAVEICDLFLNEGTIVTIKGRKQQVEKVYEAKAGDTLFEPAARRPMAVLVNRFSASAAEIVSACLQDHGRAVVVGERSFGKGSVQHLYPLENSSTALKLTTATYWRPSGKNIHRYPDTKETDEWGVKPDDGYDVKLTDEERRQYALGRRNKDIVDGKPEPGREKKDKKVVPFTDKVLDRATEYLRAELRKQG